MKEVIMKHGTTAKKIMALVEANPLITATEIATTLGIARQSVYSHAKTKGIELKKQMPGIHSNPRVWKGQFGNEKKLGSHFIGGTSEMYACADLLRRGIPVYRAITFMSSADLIADMDGKLVRVEVKSAKRGAAGHLQYASPKPDKFDVLALVDPDGKVEYRPSID
jgi:hypothetical protein